MYYTNIVIEVHGDETTLHAHNAPIRPDEPLFVEEVGRVFINGVTVEPTQKLSIDGSPNVSIDLRNGVGEGEPDAYITIED